MWSAASDDRTDLAFRDSDSAAAVDGLNEAANVRARNIDSIFYIPKKYQNQNSHSLLAWTFHNTNNMRDFFNNSSSSNGEGRKVT